MSFPKISVVMSTYNCQDFVSQAVESVLKQTYEDYEFIIVDDGSQDSTWQVVKRYEVVDSRIKLIRLEKNVGISGALNKGLEVSVGQFIARQDADDWSSPERFGILVKYLEDHPEVGLVASQANIVDVMGNLIKVGFEIRDNDEIQQALIDRQCLCDPTFMLRRTYFEAAGFYFVDDLSLTEGYDLCLRIAEVSALQNIEKPIYYYRQHQGSVSSKRRFHQMTNKAIALERALIRRYGDNPAAELKAILARDYLRAAVLGFKGEEISHATDLLKKAIDIKPDLFDFEEPFAQIIQRYAPDKQPEAMISFVQDVFEHLLPKGQKFNQLKNKIIAKYYVASAFEHADNHHPLQAVQQLSAAIIKDPAWLKNRGVRSMLLRMGIR